MSKEFLSNYCDNQVLDDYLKLLAFSTQQTKSEHALISLKAEVNQLKIDNANLKKQLSKSLGEWLRDESLYNWLKCVQPEILLKLQQSILEIASGKVKRKIRNLIKDSRSLSKTKSSI